MDGKRHPHGVGEPDRAARPDPGAAAFSEDGVDLTLIRWMLGLDPTERLRAAQDMADTVDRLRGDREPRGR